MSKMTPYQKRAFDQGVAWVNGNPRHEPINDECTPDFSCCVPELFETSREKRRKVINDWCLLHDFPKLTDS